MKTSFAAILGPLIVILAGCATLRGTGDLGVIIEREKGGLWIVDTSKKERLSHIDNLGDLSHASVVYSRDQRYAFVFGRDGGLTKVDLLKSKIEKRIIQSGNSIGGAISQDGSLVAASNYEPGGVKVFRTADLSPVADISAVGADGKVSKVVGLVDAPGQKFIFSLFEAGEIWVVDLSEVQHPKVQKFPQAGRQPYDGLVTEEGRYYLAGLFGEDGIALLDLWHPEKGVTQILKNYGRGQQKLPVYKMPHFEGWAVSGALLFAPAVGRHEVLVIDRQSWTEKKRIEVAGQPVFVMPSPDRRQIWVNFALPDNDTIQVIDSESLKIVHSFKPGPGVLHMEFAPKGENVWLSVRDGNRVEVYSTKDFKKLTTFAVDHPSGIFFTNRAQKIGL